MLNFLRTRLAWPACAALLLGLAACGADETAAPSIPSIERGTFVATYVDLRASALRRPSGKLTEEDRARILSEHGVSEADLLAFADAHGSNPSFMRAVWDDVEVRLEAEPVHPPTQDTP